MHKIKLFSLIKINSLLVLLLILVVSVKAQYKSGSLSNGILPQVVPPSPEANSLGKFGEFPVSQYTGTANISIPIFTVNIAGYQLPIQLSYHTGGVKIDEVSSWVGTNWTLNAGGCITRTIVGLPDEDPGRGLLYNNQHGKPLKNIYFPDTPEDYATLSKAADGELDTEADLFFYNFGGLSGKFFFDESGNFQTVPAGNLKLLKCPINNTLNSTSDLHWEIADANGNVYHFGSYQNNDNGFEKTGIFDNLYSTRYTTSWYLTKIVLANSTDIINFNYIAKNEIYDLPLSQSFRILTNTEPLSWQYNDGGTISIDPFKANQIFTNGANSFMVSGKSALQNIQWRGGQIQFISNTIRQDLNPGKMLDLISVYNQAGTKIKDFTFNYYYTQKRYYLQTLSESNGLLTNPLTHIFSYIQPSSLPIRGSFGTNPSFAQDHWGFYNGAISNSNMLPPNTDIANGYLNANREPNETYMMYGTMNKIQYPTSGYTNLEFEAHRYDPASSINSGPSSAINRIILNCTAANPQPGSVSRVQNFTVPFSQNNCNLNIQFKNYNKPASKEQGWLPLIRIEKNVSGTYQTIYGWDAYDQFPVGNVPPANQYGLIDFSINTLLNFSPGDYRIITDLVCGITNCATPVAYPSVVSQLIYFNYNGQLPMAGGLRIKTIKNYTADNNLATAKQFVYQPGKLLIYPKYEHQYAEYLWPYVYIPHTPGQLDPKTPCYPLYAKYKEITSSSQAILGFTQGAPVGYTLVKEQDITGTGEEKGYTEYSFSYSPDELNDLNFDFFYWPNLNIQNAAIVVNNYDYKRGILLAKQSYKKIGTNSYKIIYSLNNNYDFNDRFSSIKSLRAKKMVLFPAPGWFFYTFVNGYNVPGACFPFGGSLASLAPSYSFYNTVTNWVKLLSVTEYKYDQDGLNPLTTATNYSYNNLTHLQITSSTVNDSKGNNIKTDLKYPADFSTISPYDAMIASNIISPVIEQVQTNVTLTKELSRYKNNYQFWQGNTLILPVTNQTSILGNILENEMVVNSYDLKGNVLQATPRDGIVKSFIWDYLNIYPVAQSINSSQTDIAYSSFEAEGKGNWTFTGIPITDATAPTGKKVYNLSTGNITKSISAASVFIISYWRPVILSALTIAGTQAGYPITGRTVNGWKYYEHKITGQTLATITGTGSIDELRLYPATAQMTTYTYEPLVGITSQCDINNKIIYYEYDSFQRLKYVLDQDKNTIKKICYNYAGQVENCAN